MLKTVNLILSFVLIPASELISVGYYLQPQHTVEFSCGNSNKRIKLTVLSMN